MGRRSRTHYVDSKEHMIVSEIFKVQPMTGPTGKIFTLRFRFYGVTWQSTLSGYNGRNTDYIFDTMQEKYPGPYTIQQRYDSERGGWYYTMEWADEAEKTMWMLKYT
jgi:hypothetical protein